MSLNNAFERTTSEYNALLTFIAICTSETIDFNEFIQRLPDAVGFGDIEAQIKKGVERVRWELTFRAGDPRTQLATEKLMNPSRFSLGSWDFPNESVS